MTQLILSGQQTGKLRRTFSWDFVLSSSAQSKKILSFGSQLHRSTAFISTGTSSAMVPPENLIFYRVDEWPLGRYMSERNILAIEAAGYNVNSYYRCSKPTKLYFTFDEILTKDDVDFKRPGCVNAVCYELEHGTYHLESFEPYTMRYLKLNVLQGTCKVESLYLREYANSETEEARFSCRGPGRICTCRSSARMRKRSL